MYLIDDVRERRRRSDVIPEYFNIIRKLIAFDRHVTRDEIKTSLNNILDLCTFNFTCSFKRYLFLMGLLLFNSR